MGEWLQEWSLGEGRAFQSLPLLSSLSRQSQHTWARAGRRLLTGCWEGLLEGGVGETWLPLGP